jgi:hypothetical protein
VGSTNGDCEKIEHVVAKMLRGSRVTCSHQLDTGAFLVTIEFQQSMKTFRMTRDQYRKVNWQEALFKAINDWIGTVVADLEKGNKLLDSPSLLVYS